MIKKAFLAGIAAAALGPAALSAVCAAELRGIALSSGADSAQLTLDLSEAATHRLFTLEHPDRVVVDLSHTRLAAGVRAPAGSGVVSGMRFGSQPHGTLRVVVQLKTPLPAHALWGSGAQGSRLMLNLGQPVVATSVEASPRAVRAQQSPLSDLWQAWPAQGRPQPPRPYHRLQAGRLPRHHLR